MYPTISSDIRFSNMLGQIGKMVIPTGTLLKILPINLSLKSTLHHINMSTRSIELSLGIEELLQIHCYSAAVLSFSLCSVKMVPFGMSSAPQKIMLMII